MIPRRTTLILLPALLGLSCDPAEETEGTLFTDSAGVIIATAEFPRWSSGEGWRVIPDPLLEVGSVDGPAEEQFTEVVAAVRLSDGRLAVADRGASEIRIFGPGGAFLGRAGRQGEGPGEFRDLGFLGRMGGDSLVTFDWGLRRVQIFDPLGGFARAIPIESPLEVSSPDKAIDMINDSLVAVRIIDFGAEVPSGIVRWPHELVASLEVGSGRVDSVAYVPGSEANVVPRPDGGYSHGQVVFGKGNEFSAGAGRVAIIDTEAYGVDILDSRGKLLLTVRRSVPTPPAGAEEMDRYVRGVLDLVFPSDGDFRPEDRENFRRNLLDRPRASTLPVLRSVQLDAEGNVWVEPYYHLGEEPPPWQVFAPDGTWLGAVTLPAGLDRGVIAYQAPYLRIGADYVLGVWTDELDVPYVRVYPLEKD